MEFNSIELAALGRPLFPGMLYDCRMDSFIPGVTLWDKKSLREDVDSCSKAMTDLKFSSSDSLSSKASLLGINTSLKASLLGGLVEVGGSAKFLNDTKSSNQQSRVTMHYSETSRFDQLTMTQLGKIIYPQVFNQKTATHVVTAVLYGAHAFMVFERSFTEYKNKQDVEGELNVMVKKIPRFSIEGKGKMTDEDNKKAENIIFTFYGDVHLEQNPTTYMEALEVYKNLPNLLKKNPQNAVPIKVWLYPLCLLDTKAAQLEREISTHLISNTEDMMEKLRDVERTCNDLSRRTVFSDIKDRLSSFQDSLSNYKMVLRKELARVLPAIRGGGMEEQSLEDILKMHSSSPFNAHLLNQWLEDAKSELELVNNPSKTLKEINTEDTDRLNCILLDPDINVVVCLTFTSLKYKDPYLSTLKEFLKSDRFKELDGEKTVTSGRKWFKDPEVIAKMRENLCLFKRFSEANKNNKSIRFIISVISNQSIPGSSIYLYENGKLTDTKFQPVSKPPPPLVKNVLEKTVSLKLQKPPTAETVKYRVEYKQVKAGSGAEEHWLVINTADEDFTLHELIPGKQYLIRYRIVGKVGVSEVSDTVSPTLFSTSDRKNTTFPFASDVFSLSSRRLVLLGKSGVGKSAAGNTILGQTEFFSMRGMDSVTSKCSEACATVSGRSVSVVDTPGLSHTKKEPEELAEEIARSLYLSSPGPHAFLIVIRVTDNFTDQEEEILQQIKMMFGQEVLKYSFILFTHGDWLESIETIIERYPALRCVVDQCGGRYHIFNNEDENNKEQVNDLLQKIDSMIEQNRGGYYSNQMYEYDQRLRREEERKKQEENETLRIQMQDMSTNVGAVCGGLLGAAAGGLVSPAGATVGKVVGSALGAAAGRAFAQNK